MKVKIKRANDAKYLIIVSGIYKPLTSTLFVNIDKILNKIKASIVGITN